VHRLLTKEIHNEAFVDSYTAALVALGLLPHMRGQLINVLRNDGALSTSDGSVLQIPCFLSPILGLLLEHSNPAIPTVALDVMLAIASEDPSLAIVLVTQVGLAPLARLVVGGHDSHVLKVAKLMMAASRSSDVDQRRRCFGNQGTMLLLAYLWSWREDMLGKSGQQEAPPGSLQSHIERVRAVTNDVLACAWVAAGVVRDMTFAGLALDLDARATYVFSNMLMRLVASWGAADEPITSKPAIAAAMGALGHLTHVPGITPRLLTDLAPTPAAAWLRRLLPLARSARYMPHHLMFTGDTLRKSHRQELSRLNDASATPRSDWEERMLDLCMGVSAGLACFASEQQSQALWESGMFEEACSVLSQYALTQDQILPGGLQYCTKHDQVQEPDLGKSVEAASRSNEGKEVEEGEFVPPPPSDELSGELLYACSKRIDGLHVRRLELNPATIMAMEVKKPNTRVFCHMALYLCPLIVLYR
jgi:hypothetical protein